MSGVSAEVLDLLRCPACQESLQYRDCDPVRGTTAVLTCRCGVVAPVRDGIPRFVADDGYVANFSFEWHRHARTQLDSQNADRQSEKQFQARLNRPLEWLEGKVVLDAGCGMGRYAEIAARYGATVVCADFSYAIDVARSNLARFPSVYFVQADLARPPFAQETFDLVYSFGVLHHTPDAASTFQAVAKLVKPGGAMSIFVYASYNKAIVYSSDFWRRLTTRLPHSVLHWLSAAAIPLYYVYSLPVVGLVAKTCLPISMEPHWRWRWLDTFDWYSPRFQSKHTHAEVASWFQQAGFGELFVGEGEVTMAGSKLTRC
jgi:SAM-dependent methyltransferase